MTHPNRYKLKRNPSIDDIRASRTEAHLTQTQAGAMLYTSDRVWRQWESGDRRMHPAFWELFTLKTATNIGKLR